MCYGCAIVFGIEDPMAYTIVALMMRVMTVAGWRYFPAAYAQNNRVKPGVAVVGGQEVKHPTGYYALRFCKGSEASF